MVSDIDECSSQNPPCQNGRCLNTIGSFRCSCQSGYSVSLDGRSCLGILYLYRLFLFCDKKIYLIKSFLIKYHFIFN